jgi:hypothetical protein
VNSDNCAYGIHYRKIVRDVRSLRSWTLKMGTAPQTLDRQGVLSQKSWNFTNISLRTSYILLSIFLWRASFQFCANFSRTGSQWHRQGTLKWTALIQTVYCGSAEKADMVIINLLRLSGIYAINSNIKKLFSTPHTSFMCFVWFPQQESLICLNRTKHWPLYWTADCVPWGKNRSFTHNVGKYQRSKD